MKKTSKKEIETIKYKGNILCHIFRKNIRANGVRFLTPDSYTLQLGLLEHPSKTVLKDHAHNKKVKYNVNTTQEFLFIQKGKVRVTIFSNDWKIVANKILTEGDFLLHVDGGHGFKVLEKCRMIEIKQGPYPGEKMAKLYPKSNEKSSPKAMRRHAS